MALFDSLVLLLFVASFLLVGARRLGLPYPTLLCLAGVAVALLPHAPAVGIDPKLALTIFIAPALLDAGWDTAPRELKPLWPALLTLAVGAVAVTTAAVAAVAVLGFGLPLFAALALGAIVAPPDGAAVSAATRGVSGTGALSLLLAAPGGVALGLAAGWLYVRVKPLFANTLSNIIVEFTSTFGVWIVAEWLQLSPVLAVASYAMLLAQKLPGLVSARDRVQSYAVWSAAVFVLNVLAFLLMGLQARAIFGELGRAELRSAGELALAVLATVVLVRAAMLFGYRAIAGYAYGAWGRPDWMPEPGPWRLSAAMAWCGMRGLVTLATAFALPAHFPARNAIVLAAFAVVLGTLVVQGATLQPVMRLLGVGGDDAVTGELARARRRLLHVGMREAAQLEDPSVAAMLRRRLGAAAVVSRQSADPQDATPFDRGFAQTVEAQRGELHRMRGRAAISDDIFHRLEEELDWLELASRPNSEIEIGQV